MTFQRSCEKLTVVTVTNAVATCTQIVYGNFAGGQVYVAANSTLTHLTWYGSHDGVTYTPVQDGTGTAVTSVVAPSTTGCNCLIPAACFANAFLKAVGTWSDAVVTETVNLSLKS